MPYPWLPELGQNDSFHEQIVATIVRKYPVVSHTGTVYILLICCIHPLCLFVYKLYLTPSSFLYYTLLVQGILHFLFNLYVCNIYTSFSTMEIRKFSMVSIYRSYFYSWFNLRFKQKIKTCILHLDIASITTNFSNLENIILFSEHFYLHIVNLG